MLEKSIKSSKKVTKIMRHGSGKKEVRVIIDNDNVTLNENTGELAIKNRNTGIIVLGEKTYGIIGTHALRHDLEGKDINEVVNTLSLYRNDSK